MPKTIAIAVFGLLVTGGAGLSVVLIAHPDRALPKTQQGIVASESSLSTRLALTNSIPSPPQTLPFDLAQGAASPSSPSPSSLLSPADQQIFDRLIKKAMTQNWHQRSLGDGIQAIADQFVGMPYAAHLLDQTPTETLFVSLREFDCLLFVETVLAMAQGIVKQDYSATTMTHRLQEQRYVNGEINGYCSRLHYFSQWISENQRRGIVEDMTPSFGGIPLNKTLNFMSTNWKKYPKLVESEKEHQCIQHMEATIDASQVRYIPISEIHHHYAQLQAGDIVAIATRISGLDVTHTGFVYRTSQDVGLIHAAPGGVRISTDLQTYVSRVEDAIGIIVVRPKS